jgi:hypothetical protein
MLEKQKSCKICSEKIEEFDSYHRLKASSDFVICEECFTHKKFKNPSKDYEKVPTSPCTSRRC